MVWILSSHKPLYYHPLRRTKSFYTYMLKNRSKIVIMRSAKERSFRYYHREGLTTITNFKELYLHVIRTVYNRSRIEIKCRAKEWSFRYYHHKGLTTITNFTEQNPSILTHYNRSKIEIIHITKEKSFRYFHHEGLITITNFYRTKSFLTYAL